MAVHSEAQKLQPYSPNRYPSISGGEQNFITQELTKIKNAIDQLVSVVKALEARMNTNGLS